MNAKSKPEPPRLDQFPYHHPITTRWRDNDVYGHVNNVVYYSWFDTAVNGYLVDEGVLDFSQGETVGLVVETQCNYYQPVAFPDSVTVGVVVTKLGNSSVRFELGIFKNHDTEASASGHFIHVYVDERTRRPVSLPEPFRQALIAIASDSVKKGLH